MNARRSKANVDTRAPMNRPPMIFQLASAPDFRFPDVELAGADGLLAIGGDLSCERLLSAYRNGIFPWFTEGQPILWWSPDPRAILVPGTMKVSRSLKKTIRKNVYTVTLDRDFPAVIQGCAAPRTGDPVPGTWITEEMKDAYLQLHQMGYAHSVEVWNDRQLVGGLYGVALGKAFFGESMFSRQADASKVGLHLLATQLQQWGYHFIDCQVESGHLSRLGAVPMPRKVFTRKLALALANDDRRGRWQADVPELDR
jgi:leucyl/phenylalanyl-tRNA--protein transferase